MEELRSTEALDTEIRNDARRKAGKILEKAEESAGALLADVDKKVQDAVDAARQSSRSRLALYEKNINASLPLEKERRLVSYIHNAVIEAMNAYFDGLGEAKRLDIIRGLVERYRTVLSGTEVHALAVGIDVAAAEKMLRKLLGASLLSCKAGDSQMLMDEAVPGFTRREGLVLRSADGQIVCRLTLDEKVKEILDTQRAELASTLFCGRLPE